MVNTTALITAIIGLVIGVLVLTSLGYTVITNTYTGPCTDGTVGYSNATGCRLANASATGKTMFNLLELLYPVMGVVFIVSVGFALKARLD